MKFLPKFLKRVFAIDINSIDHKLIIPSRLIYDIRMKADVFVNTYKARLVAQGNHQDSSTYFETFADTASALTINILLGIAASKNLKISTIDFKIAILFYTRPSRKLSISNGLIYCLILCLILSN